MPSQFSPSDRDTVREATEEHSHVHETTAIGPGLFVVYTAASDTHIRGYDGLTSTHGWYVALYEPDENGDKAVLMPIDEVPE